jgi:hypothetical protein
MQQSSQHEYHRHHWHHGHKRTSTTSPTSQKSQTLSSRTSGICTTTHGAGSFKVEVLAKFETTLENDFLAETSAQVSFYFILNKPGLENVFSWRGRELDEISCLQEQRYDFFPHLFHQSRHYSRHLLRTLKLFLI